MGTRADFYVGRGPEAEWIGSVAWDGYPDGFAVNPVGDFDVALQDIRRAIEYLNDFDGQSKGMSFHDAVMLPMYAVPLKSAYETFEKYRPEGEKTPTFPMFTATTEEEYRDAFAKHIATRKDFTSPEDGWPWPWEDSTITDYTYCFDEGQVWGYDGTWFDVAARLDETEEEAEAREKADEAEDFVDGKYVPRHERPNPYPFPDMTARKNVQMNSEKGGILVIGRTPDGKVSIK